MSEADPPSEQEQPDPDAPDLEARVERLEAAVADLESTVQRLANIVGDAAPGRQQAPPEPSEREPSEREPSDSAPPTSRPSSRSAEDASSWTERMRRRADALLAVSSEDWLSRVGIGLLLFGLVFLFRYAVDEGWLVPSVRVGFGAVLGGVLLAGGWRTYVDRRRLGQVFLGGSSAAFYATIFAAYQLYDLLPYPYAFAAMVAITVWTFVIAIQQDDAALGVVGLAGGLATPFLLYTGAGNVPGFVAYVCLVLTGGVAVYLARGWRSLLWTTVVGVWAALLVAALDQATGAPEEGDRWALLAALTYAWLLLGSTPVVRALLEQQNPNRWALPALSSDWWERELSKRPPYVLVNASPLLALAGARMTWGGGDLLWGSLALAGAALYVGLAVGLRRQDLLTYASAHALAASVLAAYGLSNVTVGPTLLIALAAEAAALLVIGSRLPDTPLRLSGHGLMGLVGAWWSGRVSIPDAGLFVDGSGLSELLVLGLAGGAATQLRGRYVPDAYRLAVHVGWLAWVWSHLVPLDNGQAYVSAVWGATAVALLIGSTWLQTAKGQYLGLATLAVFVGKLFLVDLAALPALWRIALFLASGGLFLLLSYSLPGVLRSNEENHQGDEQEGE